MNKLFIVIASLALSACDLDLGSSYDPTTRTMYVDYYQEACDESSISLCLRTRFDIEDDFEINTVSMSGFDNLQWGSRYTVQVEAERDGDGKDTHYRFESIDSTEIFDASNNNFLLTFNMTSQILLDNQNSSWIIAAEKVFSCSAADCILLAESYRDDQKIQLSFSAENDELTLLAVKCQSSDSNFTSECEGINDAIFDVAHYRSDCGLSVPKLCSVYKEEADASTDWNVLPFEITGFTAQWGKQYQLNVEVKIEAKDLKSVTFKSEETAATDQINESFRMVMRTGASGLEVSANDVIRYDGMTFNCSQLSQCNDIDDAVERATDANEQLLILEAFVESSGETPVIVISDLICDEQSDVFKTECVAKHDDVYWNE
ncbi:MAG: hypothetical protein V7765_11275 [Oleispira sp.]